MACLKTRLALAFSCQAILFGLSTPVAASGFQLWEQDGASIGNYHAGYAAWANDASTAFYNPAGLTRFKNQQVVLSGAAALPSFTYKGVVSVNTVDDWTPQHVTAQGGAFGFIPGLNYVAPLSDNVAFGFNVVVPFGLKSDYGTSTALRYITTVSSVNVIDISPSLAFKFSDKGSFGIGPDVQVMNGEFDQVATLGGSEQDSDGINKASDTAYGYHLGFLYEFTPDTRAGLSYHSQVVHHLIGKSDFTGPLADIFNTTIQSRRAKLNLTLPPYTALSFYHKVQPRVALMASAIYTQWSTIENLVMQRVAGLKDTEPSNNITVVIPQHFRNTWNFSIGADFLMTDTLTLRGGLGYDQTPVNENYRNPQLPDNNRYAVALGGHYQTTKSIGIDLGWTHLFINKAHIYPPVQVTGDEQAQSSGSVTGGADVFGAQLTWDIA